MVEDMLAIFLGIGRDGSPEPAPPPRERAGSPAVVAGVTVADADALDCRVCCLPLKPPIFQGKPEWKRF
ncbi:hypothetical protein ACP70R_041295 [Stipagrostis hirtigluma subsp. patula]